MKHDARFSLLLVLLLSISSALGHAQDSQDDRAGSEFSTSIAAARCQYTAGDPACTGTNASNEGDHTGHANDTIAQFPRRVRPPLRSRRPMRHPGNYAPMWTGGDGRHVLIGALVGFGLGAAIGANGNTDQHPGVTVKAALAVGTIGGLLGAAIGASVPSFYARNLRHRAPWHEKQPDEEEDHVASRSEPAKSSGN
jgi:hypothetical protein